jgi:protein-tyrosine phosphatase
MSIVRDGRPEEQTVSSPRPWVVWPHPHPEDAVPAHPDPARDLSWPSCFNARDLGGYAAAGGRRTRWRTLFRADNMSHLTAEGPAALVRDGVRTVVDLLSDSDHRFDPPHPFRGHTVPDATLRYVHAPMLDEADGAAVAALDRATSREAAYCARLDTSGRQVARIVRAVADAPEGGVVFHCHAGLDRTGLVAALLLAAVGVPADTIADDYALSEERLGAFYEHYVAQVADPAERAAFQRLTAPREPMLAVLDHLDARYGGASAYLRAVGVTDDELARLRERLLE